MELKHLVVDGSNIATEGRSLPSLKQLDEAVRAFLADHTAEHVTVIVDATFGHRIDAAERAEYEEAILAGEVITPPAGAIGRGDKFILQVADRANAAILSNDSFQEFHGEYPWLFDEGRLVGGKPVPGVGWVFLLRTPVRGPASRRSVREARTAGSTTGDPSRSRRGGRRRKSTAAEAEAEAKVAAAVAEVSSGSPPRGSITPINEPLPFIEFVANHPVGSVVEGEVERFASHGAYVRAGGARCYLSLKLMGDPPPRSAKEVLRMGEKRPFAVHAFDTPRRGIDLALVRTTPPKETAGKSGPKAADKVSAKAGEAKATDHAPARAERKGRASRAAGKADAAEPAGTADASTTTATKADHKTEGKAGSKADSGGGRRRGRRAGALNATAQEREPPPLPTGAPGVEGQPAGAPAARDSESGIGGREESTAPDAATARAAATKAPTTSSSTATKTAVDNIAQEAPVTPVKTAAAKKATAKKRAVAKRAPATKKAVAKKATAKRTAVKKTAAKKAVAKKATAKKATAKRTAVKKAVAKKATAKKATAKKAVAKKATAKRTATKKAVAKKATAKRAVAKKATAKKATAKKATAKKAVAKRAVATRTAAKKAPAKRPAVKKAAVRKVAARTVATRTTTARAAAAGTTTARKAAPRTTARRTAAQPDAG